MSVSVARIEVFSLHFFSPAITEPKTVVVLVAWPFSGLEVVGRESVCSKFDRSLRCASLVRSDTASFADPLLLGSVRTRSFRQMTFYFSLLFSVL